MCRGAFRRIRRGWTPRQVVASDAAPADEQTVSAIHHRRAGRGCCGTDPADLSLLRIHHVDAALLPQTVLARASGRRPPIVGRRGPDGEVVGHQALAADPNGLVPEFSKLMVDPGSAAMGLADVLAEVAL